MKYCRPTIQPRIRLSIPAVSRMGTLVIVALPLTIRGEWIMVEKVENTGPLRLIVNMGGIH